MERPVVVNSLLCFVQNYRSRGNLRDIIMSHFTQDAIDEARQQLLRTISPFEYMSLPSDLLDLYENLSHKENCLYVAADLVGLPLAFADEHGEKGMILREIRDLRSYITEALEGKPDDSPSNRESITPPGRCKLNNSSSSPEFPLLPAPVANGFTEQEDSSTEPKPVQSSTPVELLTPGSVDGSASSSNKRKAGPRSLDAAVKKLCEKRKAEEEDEPIVASPPPPPASEHNGWTPPNDPQGYLNMIRMMQTPQNANLLGNMIGQILLDAANGQDQDENCNGEEELTLTFEESTECQRLAAHCQDSIEEKDDAMEEQEGSPSPSDETRDDYPMLEMSVDNDSDKPYICEHSNCRKRFANKFLLKKHQFIHTGLRPHTCPFCNKKFNRKDNLLRHKKTHMQNGVPDELYRRNLLPEHISTLFGGMIPSGMEMIKQEIDMMKQESEEPQAV